nr:MAG TPA: Small Terminase [Caudoviricetes sp.]
MARAPNRRAEKAKELFDKGLKLIEIANQLNVPEGTIRSWKNRYNWECNVAVKKRNVAKKKGGQPGNKNAEGCGAPEQNKNAIKTGEFETLFFDTLNPEEKQLAAMVQPDKGQLLLQEIRLLIVREHRMLKRIEVLRRLEEREPAAESDGENIPPGMSVTEYSSGIEKGKPTELRKYEGILGQIQAIEDALTRVQARQQKAIETLHKFGYDDARLELETMRFEFELLKQDGQNEDTEDDGFLDAMNASAESVWGDVDV